MTPRLLAGAVLVAVGGFAVGRWWPGPTAVVGGVVLAVLVGLAAVAVEGRWLRRLADHADGWLADRDMGPAPRPGGEAWDRLGGSLDTLGDAYRQRGRALEHEHPWRSELVDSLVQPALLFSVEGRMLAANDGARKLLRIPAEAAELTVMQAVGNVALTKAVREARQVGAPVTVDTEQGDHSLRAVVSLLGDQALMIIADRTIERRVEELRRNFVVNASHELKTPVTSIQTLAEALEVTIRTEPGSAGPLVKRLGGEAERLARLVHDLLDLRRLEERGPLDRVPVDLAELVRRVVAGLVPRAEAAGVELAVEAPDRAIVSGVEDDLETVVKNLVANGIQYNQRGGSVEVGVDAGDGCQVVTVRDSGIGIPQQDLSRIFERFYRVDLARSRETGGTGLGLSIVRHAVERHGGTIEVDSLLGEGTTFTVVVPTESS